MASRTWLDTSGDAGANANWGTAPADGDSAYILQASQTITTNVNQSSVDLVDLYIGENVTGTIGTATSPLYYGICTGKCVVNAPSAQAVNLRFTSIPTLIVRGASASPYGFHLYSGNINTMYVTKGGTIRIGANATVTTLYVMYENSQAGDTNIIIEEGAALTTVHQIGGMVNSQVAFTTYNISGGTLMQVGESTGSITTLNMYGSANVVYSSPGTTITTLNGYGGTFDASQDGRAKTISTANSYTGNLIMGDNGTETITFTTVNKYGGKFIGKAGTLNENIPMALSR